MNEQGTGLRARLVEVGVDLVTKEGLQALTLREIARRAGVSHGAPRRYFPTHLSLLSAIARRGFEDLAARTAQAVAAARPKGDPRAQLDLLGRVYLDFARTDQGMYDLMFRHDLLESSELGLRETSLPLYRTLVDVVGRARAESGASGGDGPGADPVVVAGALWANLHGIAQLWGWGSLQFATGGDDVEPLLRAALDAHLGTRTP
ncbi:TetR/AcrR family transcriptional regulator [Streptomyces marianii]|uniref:TetR/AcrR family transcriptional regulator n=1 Tax=Streptomyces marianii TaxID=1817406 RepID=A0A5R9E5S3_9ACTN|nr:TetR/AcrR family transcriptional regulator [Streptomyces marianii]TLQ45360.1 TetR/AcrR family transcriptional regulator [Streptomyces marianii]